MAGIALQTAQEINNLCGNMVLNFLQLDKQVHQVKAALDATELMGPPFNMSQEDNDQIKKAFAILDTAFTALERETDFVTLQQLTQFRTF